MADLCCLQIVIWYFFQICSGMSHIHECGIVHRYCMWFVIVLICLAFVVFETFIFLFFPSLSL